MTDPGAGCGSPTGNTGTDEDAEDLLTFTDGTRVTFGDDDDAALAALLTMSVDPTGDDTEVCDEHFRGIMFMGTGACGTELEDRYASVITMGGDAAVRFTVFDVIGGEGNLHRGDSTIFDAAGAANSKVLVGA